MLHIPESDPYFANISRSGQRLGDYYPHHGPWLLTPAPAPEFEVMRTRLLPMSISLAHNGWQLRQAEDSDLYETTFDAVGSASGRNLDDGAMGEPIFADGSA